MSAARSNKTIWSAAELRRLPAHERDVILESAAARAAVDYASNPELTAFDAFGTEDLYVDSSDAEAG